ncbi:hypothetical protein GmHk_04G010579 [Glycine max]|nr:hypothetical protein GmHk_04G010579 [Glycine max]
MGTLQAFRASCRFFCMESTIGLFLYHFMTRPIDQASYSPIIWHGLDFANVYREVSDTAGNAFVIQPTDPLPPPCSSPIDVVPFTDKNKKKRVRRET